MEKFNKLPPQPQPKQTADYIMALLYRITPGTNSHTVLKSFGGNVTGTCTKKSRNYDNYKCKTLY